MTETQIKPTGAKHRMDWCREGKFPAHSFRHRDSNNNFKSLSFHFLVSFKPHGGKMAAPLGETESLFLGVTPNKGSDWPS